ncbi:PREDICTED: uncharacterized protein LOC105368382 [Ceratosolen solmsi marchali]|uniref:Uncharacterized protein LOC105368382 n=1 Tax=Ceratosolen solmsi marchali TaxID=326594 RepID=A0AAJ7E2Q9_9HYME|nr:PREDICTED: uncharacterized protein LOC105368382 [Ceratosolen solmsi marchali]
MIRTINKCGCSAYNLPNNPHSQCFHANEPKFCPSKTSLETDEVSCGCGSNSNSEEKENKLSIKSEIVEKGLPYKEIEAIINDNRMVIRMQVESPQPEFEPSCDCIAPIGEHSFDENAEIISKYIFVPFSMQGHHKNDVTFRKSSQGCKTITLYPQPKQKFFDRSDKSEDGKVGNNNSTLSTVHPEENPNIFVLKIKKKRENGDKKYNFNLEYLQPRPWRKQNCSS